MLLDNLKNVSSLLEKGAITCTDGCAEEINTGDIHVDHALPWQVACHHELWNLV